MNQNKGALVIICVLGLVIGIGLSYFFNPNNKLVDDLNTQIKDLESKNQTLEKEKADIKSKLDSQLEKSKKIESMAKRWFELSTSYMSLGGSDLVNREFEFLDKIHTHVVVKRIDVISGNQYILCATQGSKPQIILCVSKKPLKEVNIEDTISVYITYFNKFEEKTSMFTLDYYEKL